MNKHNTPEQEDDYKDVIVSTKEKRIKEVAPPNEKIIEYKVYKEE
jgi:hypothetical protein